MFLAGSANNGILGFVPRDLVSAAQADVGANYLLLDHDTSLYDAGRFAPQLRELAGAAFPHYPYINFFEDFAFAESLIFDRHLSLLALHEGRVIGHNAIVKDRWAGVRAPRSPHHAVEMGRAMVAVGEQGHGVGGALARLRHLLATQRFQPRVCYSDCATGHEKSARVLSSEGYLPLGLLLGVWDDTFDIKQRESALVMASIQGEKNPEPMTVHVPEAAMDLARMVFDIHGQNRVVTTADRQSSGSLPQFTVFDTRTNPIARSLEIFVHQPGKDIGDIVQALIAIGAQSVAVHLKINTPDVALAYHELAGLGFFPGLVWPEFGIDEDGKPFDVLTVQYLSPDARQGFDPERIKVPAGAAEAVKKLVVGQMPLS